MKLSFWRKTAAVLMAALLALSTPVLAISETVEAAATAETTAAPAATETPVVTEAPVETEATTEPEVTEAAAETTTPESAATATPAEEPTDAAPADSLPIDGNVSINATKPSKLQKTIVDKMQIRAYAMGSEKYGSEMSSCSPSVHAKGVAYDIGPVEGSEEEGWYTTVTFHFQSGDAFELKARDNFNTLYSWSDKLNGDWSYHFTDEWPADQVLTLYRVNNKWCVKSKDGSYSSNISSNIANYIHIYLAVPGTLEYTVTYTDGVNGEAFVNQTYTVKEGDATPAFVGEPTREGYIFAGWKPEVAATVTANATYTAQWEKAIPEYTVTYTDGAEGEAFVDQNYTVKEGSATPAFEGEPTRENYTFTGWEPEVAETVTADVTYTAQWTPSTAKKPAKNITANDVKGMKFRAFAEGTEVLLGTMMDCQPSKASGKDVSYTINQIEGNDVDGYTTSVTFHFVSGDKLESAAREVFNTDRHYTAITGWDKWIGNWTYNFTDERPADQTLTLYWVVASNGKGSWKIKSTTPQFGEWATNLTTAVANHIKVNLKLERTVTYTDGVNGAAFANQTYTVRNGSATPAFNGTPTRAHYTFAGWKPEVAETVYADVTYVAQWTPEVPKSASNVVYGDSIKFHCTTVESHEDTSVWQSRYVNYVNDSLKYDETRGVWTAQMVISSVQTQLNLGPNKTWGQKHFYTDENGKDITSYTFSVYFDPEASVVNSNGETVTGWWRLDNEIVLNVWCYTAPSAPTMAKLKANASLLWVRDSENTRNYTKYTVNDVKKLPEVTYSIGQMTQDENGDFWCELTITTLAPYVDAFQAKYGSADKVYELDTEKNLATYSFKLKYTGSKTAYAQDGSGWEIVYDTNKEKLNGKEVWVTADFSSVTYTDGVDGSIFADQVYARVRNGKPTPAFQGDTPARKGYVFMGWDPAVAETVTADVVYTAKWGEDKNGNGIPDDLEDKFVVTYTDGVNGEVFEDQVYSDLLSGLDTPAFNGTPARKGYVFMGWDPAVTDKVSESVIYTAQWELDENNNGKPDKEEDRYSVTYTDGVADEEVFADQKTEGLLEGVDTPAFNGTPERKGYVFAGWKPEVAKTVSGDATYTALWTVDKNGNGIPDDQEEHFTVTYTDGTKKHTVFADQVFTGLVKGEATPSFEGKPTRKGYKFLGWKPEVEQTVSGNVTYTARWAKIETTDEDEVPKTGDTAASSMATMLMSLACMGLAVMLLLARSKAQKNH